MPAPKRLRKGTEGDVARPAQRPKLEDTSTPSETVALGLALARISGLEQQIQDLHAYINAKGLTRSVPDSIRRHMNQQPNAAKILADQVRAAARPVYERLSLRALSSKRTGVTSDDISEAMMKFLKEVQGVRDLPGGTAPAFDLAMTLAAYTYGDLNNSDHCCSGYGDRPSDPVVDTLLSELAAERRQLEPSWDFEKALESMRKRAKKVSEYGIDDFCSGTIELLSGWQKSSPAVVHLTSKTKAARV